MALQFTFVEIENPKLRLFNGDYSFTQEFNHALQQIRDWKLWAEKNIESLLNMYADLFESYNVTNDYKSIKCYLICGRRSDVESPILAKEQWSSLQSASDQGISIMTFDRLTANVACLPSNDIYSSYAMCSYKERGFFLKSDSINETERA